MSNILHSEKIDLIAQSLHKLQNELDNIKKDAQAYNYKYATLGSCIDHTRDLLFKYDLSVTHLNDFDEKGNQFSTTYLLHTSGQYMASRVLYAQGIEPLTTEGTKLEKKGEKFVEQVVTKTEKDIEMKALGLCMTYARRYGFKGILNLADDDDEDKLGNTTLKRGSGPLPLNTPPKNFPPKLPPVPTLNVEATQNKNKIKGLCETSGIPVMDFAEKFNLSSKTPGELKEYIDNFEIYKNEYFISVMK